ncbi:cysteine desulfurase family protein [Chitinophaga sp.]|uniref:cysteine desulfurase family protein n=1 Tax=Chitinophaga sp. TaxID=1869181 RepID=UPI0031D9A507
MHKAIYMDYCATTPCDPGVVEKMLPFFTGVFGNAASGDHIFGWEAKEAVDEAREKVARLIHGKSSEITFTSGATEAINLALKGLMESGTTRGKHIITNRAEHKAVLDTCAYLEDKGYEVTWLDVDEQGSISLEALENAVRPDTAVIAIQYANNETGVIHPVREIGSIARKKNVYFLCDATQAVGKIPVDVVADKIDMLAFSGHKIYGPKGIGVLYVNNQSKINLSIQQHGGNHERGRRSGTLNVPAIVGIGEAASICQQELSTSTEGIRLAGLRNRLEAALLSAVAGIRINGGKVTRLPQVTSVLFPGVNGEQLLLAVSARLALSRGSACSSAQRIPSHVIMAMGLGETAAHDSIRFSLGRFTKEEEVDAAVGILCNSNLIT